MAVSIIIVNYNVTNEVDGCIRSIYEYASKIEKEIIVVDNNSPDRSIELLKDKYPEVRFEFMKDNLGYSKGNNYAVKLSKYENILLLNPDTLMIEDFLSPMEQFVNENNNAGACGPMLLYKDLRFQFSNGYKLGIIYEAAEAFMFIGIYRKLLKKLNKKKYLSDKPFRVNWMSGSCLFMRKDVFNKAGGFNCDYFLNYEDIDLGNKLVSLGFINYYFPGHHCIHLDQTSQKRNYEKFTNSRYESRLIYSKNNYGFLKAILVRIIHILGLIFRLLFAPLFYHGREKTERKKGYYKSLKLYLGAANG